MTLTEIAQYAGQKIGKTDTETLTFLQKAASLAYRRVWDFAPWRETVTSSTYSLGTNRTVTLGSNVETPLSIAYNDIEIEAIDFATIISQDPGILDDARTGDPASYYFKGRNTSGIAQLDVYPVLKTAGTTPLRVIEKLKCLTRTNIVVDFPPSTDALNDELRLPHVHNIILDLTHADGLERERQYAKAQAITQEASTNLAAMANYELSQVGGIKQITPNNLGELTVEQMFLS